MLAKLIMAAALYAALSISPKETAPVVQDLGNGVLYFPQSGPAFGNEFAAWKGQHKEWIIIAVTPCIDAYGLARGYYVIANPDL